MATRNQIVGGSFQNTDGSPIANGTIRLRLSQDAEAEDAGRICSGIEVSVPLDANGDVAGTVLIWPNDQLLPDGTYYQVEIVTENGQRVYGPQYLRIPSTPAPFDLGSWVPA